MKKCPICNNHYDDSWKICITCKMDLLDSSAHVDPKIVEEYHERTKRRDDLPLYKWARRLTKTLNRYHLLYTLDKTDYLYENHIACPRCNKPAKITLFEHIWARKFGNFLRLQSDEAYRKEWEKNYRWKIECAHCGFCKEGKFDLIEEIFSRAAVGAVLILSLIAAAALTEISESRWAFFIGLVIFLMLGWAGGVKFYEKYLILRALRRAVRA